VVQAKVYPVSKHRVITTYGTDVKIKTNVFTWPIHEGQISASSFGRSTLRIECHRNLVDHTSSSHGGSPKEVTSHVNKDGGGVNDLAPPPD